MIREIMHPSPQRHMTSEFRTVETVFSLLVNRLVLLLFLSIGVGMAFGHVKVKGIGLGAVVALFLAIALTVWVQAYGIELVVTKQLGTLDLTLFTFAIGVSSGAFFFHNLKTATGPILVVVLLYVFTATISLFVGKAIGMDIALISGTFAGTVTNIPALNAAGEAPGDLATATIGYPIAYLFGVIDMLIASMTVFTYDKNNHDQPSPLVNRAIRIERDDHLFVNDVYQELGSKVTFSRLRRGETGPVTHLSVSDALDQGDLVTVVGPHELVVRVVTELGHASSHLFMQDRNYLDFRRVTVLDPKVVGRIIAGLNSITQFSGTISRVRRGDVDAVTEPGLVLQQGDQVRVVAPTSKMEAITEFFGGPARGPPDLNPIALGLDMTLGIVIDELPTLTSLGEYFSIGFAAGALIIGLIFGRLGRIGSIVTAFPFTTSQVLSELRSLTFFVQAGVNTGGQIAHAFTFDARIRTAALGFIMATIMAVGIYVTVHWIFEMGSTQLLGLLGDVQTQPVVLAFVDSHMNPDPRVALGYVLICPIAMVGRILATQILGGM